MVGTTLDKLQQQKAMELAEHNVSIRTIAEHVDADKMTVYRFLLRQRKEQKQLVSELQQIEQSGNERRILSSLSGGLDFLEFNKILGLGRKPGRIDMPVYDYELQVLSTLMKLESSVKDKHLAWMASRGLGKSWLILRIMTWLGLNELAGTNMAIVTGNRVELSVSLVSTIKSWLAKHGLRFDTKETVVEFPNGTRIEGCSR